MTSLNPTNSLRNIPLNLGIRDDSLIRLIKKDFPSLAALYLQDPHPPQDSIHASLLRRAYPLVKYRPKAIAQIKEQALSLLREMLRTALANPALAPLIAADLGPEGRFTCSLRDKLYHCGWHSTGIYISHRYDNLESDSIIKSWEDQFFNAWEKQVNIDFSRGLPHSFPQKIMQIKREIAGINSLCKDQEDRSINDLQKIAYLSEDLARKIICQLHKYCHCEIEETERSEHLFSNLQGLWNLAETGDFESQQTLGVIYDYQTMNFSDKKCKLAISKEETLKAYQKLKNYELKFNLLNDTVTTSYAYNKFGKYNLPYTLEERIEHLTERAKKGDSIALSHLWFLYLDNQLSQDTILDLSLSQRWAKVQELKNPSNASDYELRYARRVTERREMPEPMTNQERLSWIEQRALKENDSNCMDELAEVYRVNKYGDEELQIPFAERLDKLIELARRGNSKSILTLAGYFLNLPEVEQIAPDANSDLPLNPLTLEQKINHLLNIAIESSKLRYVWHFIDPLVKGTEKGVLNAYIALESLLKD